MFRFARNRMRLMEPGANDRGDAAHVGVLVVPPLTLALGLVAAEGVRAYEPFAMLLWAVASLCVGSATGFLFAIPRSGALPADLRLPGAMDEAREAPQLAARDRRSSARPNTNLEEISDWITKIIVGLTLVNLEKVSRLLSDVGVAAATSFTSRPDGAAASFATAMLCAFAVLGFLSGYLYTRLVLQGALVRSDFALGTDWERVLTEENAKRDADPVDDAARHALPTLEQVRSAQRVQDVAAVQPPAVVLQRLKRLASEYDEIRRTMSPGRARTLAMTEVTHRMSTLALAARPYLADLTRSESPGERLSAVVTLKFGLDPDYIDWLMSRLTAEAAFVAYHAASALLGGARLAGPATRRRIRLEIERIREEMRVRNLGDEHVQRLLEQILQG
jgi:hypothetical protein